MLDFPRWKVWAICLTIALGILLSIPSLLPQSALDRYPSFLPHSKISLGLDLAGGSQLLFEADVADFQRQRLTAMEDSVRTELRRDPQVETSDISIANGRVSFMVRNPADLDTAVERMRTLSAPVGLSGNRSWDVQAFDGNRVVLTPTPQGATAAIKDALTTARDVVRRRIDPSGTREITVVNQGAERILVQVPGIDDPRALEKLVGQTARLEFKLVDLTADPAQVAQGRAPAGSQVLPMVDGGAIAVQRRVLVSGEQLTNARATNDQNGRPAIEFTFNTAGAKKFGRVTQENVGKPFAIILDNKVLSAPRIDGPILGGQGQITGSFTTESANQLATSLKSGSLPIKLNVVEERTVSADLGADSIHKGAVASIVSVVAVIIFMLVTYGRFGVYANIALIVNAFLILGIMALFNATLTLPGIAGFILTIGAAVDANVLINERIREEIRRGRKVFDAIETGYHEARRAIFDANLTHVISAALMIYFGSGPVRGFAVVLLIGVVTSFFTAVFFTRMLVALWAKRARPRELHL